MSSRRRRIEDARRTQETGGKSLGWAAIARLNKKERVRKRREIIRRRNGMKVYYEELGRLIEKSSHQPFLNQDGDYIVPKESVWEWISLCKAQAERAREAWLRDRQR